MTDATVLVVTSLADVTSDLVIDASGERGARVVRIDPADALNGGVEFHAAIGMAEEAWRGTLATPTRHVELEDVTAVYYRRPSRWRSDHPQEQTREFIQTEARHGLGGVLYTLSGARYVNHPSAISKAEYKPGQLQTAARLGFTVPPTLITNDAERAREFTEKHAPVVYKPMRGLPPDIDGTAGAIWAQRIDPATIDASVAATAHLFQAEVTPKSADDPPHLQAFTRGLDQDRGAVNAAPTGPHHNSGTQGVNTRSKMLQCQMYGRAGFPPPAPPNPPRITPPTVTTESGTEPINLQSHGGESPLRRPPLGSVTPPGWPG